MKAKRYLAVVLALLCLLGVVGSLPAFAASANLLGNGNFNASDTGYWWPRGDWAGGNFVYSPGGGVDDTPCYVLTGSGKSGQFSALYYSVTKGNHPWQMVSGETYTFTAKIKKEAGQVWIGIRNNGNDAVLAESECASANGSWQTLTVKFTAFPGKVWPCIYATGLGEGQRVWVDDCVLVSDNGKESPSFKLEGGAEEVVSKLPATGKKSGNLFCNGDLNSPDVANWWTRDDWNGGLWRWTPSKGVGGSGAFGCTGKNSKEYAGVYYSASGQPAAPWQLVAGETYTMSAKVYRPAGVNASLTVNIRNDGNDSVAASSTPCKQNGTWETLSVTFVAGKGKVWPCISVTGLQTGQKIYVDDVSFISENGYDKTTYNAPAAVNMDEKTGNNLFVNGSFNRLNVYNWWIRTDWPPLQADSRYTYLFEYSGEGGVDDSGCFLVNGKGTGEKIYSAGLYYNPHSGNDQGMELTPGKTYYFSCDVWRSEGCKADVFMDVDMEQAIQASTDYAEKNGEWETIYVRFVAKQEDPVVWFRIVAIGIADGQQVKVDNMQLRVVGEDRTEEEKDFVKESGPSIVLASKSDITSSTSGEGGNLWIFLIIGIAVLLIAAGIVVFFLLRKKKAGAGEKPEEEKAEGEEPAEAEKPKKVKKEKKEKEEAKEEETK